MACIAYTLQLVLNKIINNSVSSCRKLVGHFKHSARATKVLKTCQITAEVAQHRLIQEEPTRWNTPLLYEQKRSILLASAELNIPELSNRQWTLIKNIIPILEVFNSLTNHISSDYVTAADVIPLINVIETELRKTAPAGSGLQGLKNDLYSFKKIKFKNYENSDILTSVTLLYTCFKEAPFKDKPKADDAKHDCWRKHQLYKVLSI
ncbi:hypothetical protein PR048_029631, partial [Dryococelus australis]